MVGHLVALMAALMVGKKVSRWAVAKVSRWVDWMVHQLALPKVSWLAELKVGAMGEQSVAAMDNLKALVWVVRWESMWAAWMGSN